MKEIGVHYEHWMNVHSDDWPVRIAMGIFGKCAGKFTGRRTF